MLDHIGFQASDFARSKAFYLAALAPLGVTIQMEWSDDKSSHAGFGENGKPYFWIGTGPSPERRLHVAFAAQNRAMVDAFYQAALASGGQDNGAPGLRLHYHPNYYGAFVLDPDGNNIEAVCHRPE
ncbi:VOC family protein [Consotaella salsifontis]|uniref:Predicted lactoylglutathione lyase n=1 Tax=Consotaella salsifontis TaxID=1365950 RepID=A0A1T4T4D6_9HYPH|nr:VOC family protein [Consotaella salsifontis]SKA35169.1 Predicted lactoylglutathione lyase [Consotaella salsifontis]